MDAIDRTSVQAAVRGRLYEWILEGRPPAGEAINLSESAVRLGVSVTPVREALFELQAEGLVRTEPGRGFLVTPLSVAEARELYPLVWTLECMALDAAPEFRTPHLAELDAVNARIAAAGAEPGAAVALDTEWHELLLRDSPSRTTLELLAVLKRRVRRYEFQFMRDTGGEIATHQHEEVAAALRRGDRRGARRALEANWQVGPTLLVPWLEGMVQATAEGIPDTADAAPRRSRVRA